MSESQSSLGTVRALICEDEPIAVRALREYLKDAPWVQVVGEAREGGEAMRLIHKLEPDLVFLDVQMPRLSGVEVLEAVTHRPAVVFTTAYDEYAVKAFELGAVDYLVKPFGRERLLECLGRVRVRLVGEGRASTSPARDGGTVPHGGPRAVVGPGEAAGPAGLGAPESGFADRLFARKGEAIVPVLAQDIVRLDAEGGGATVVTQRGSLSLAMTLSELEEKLDAAHFVRVHRGHLVNLRHVVEMKRYDERRLLLRFADGSSLVASRRGSETLKERMR